MQENTKKELASYAYISLLAIQSGFESRVSQSALDAECVDMTLDYVGELHGVFGWTLSLQVKCTSQNMVKKDGDIHFPLDVRAYDKLRHRGNIHKHLLVVVLAPKNLVEWVSVERKTRSTTIKGCAYWLDLAGMPAKENATSVTLKIPEANLLTPTSFYDIIDKHASEIMSMARDC